MIICVIMGMFMQKISIIKQPGTNKASNNKDDSACLQYVYPTSLTGQFATESTVV